MSAKRIDASSYLSAMMLRDGSFSRWAIVAGRIVTRRIRPGVGEQAGADLHPENAAHRFIEPRLRNDAGADLGDRVGVELAPAVGRHEHVEAGVERLRT